MRRKVLTALLLLSVLVALAPTLPLLAAEGVQGKWQATIESPRGSNDVVMDFKSTDEELQGTWTGPRGVADLEDVKYADGKLTFKRHLEIQGNSITIDYEATVDGSTMKVKMTTPRGEREFTAKRAD